MRILWISENYPGKLATVWKISEDLLYTKVEPPKKRPLVRTRRERLWLLYFLSMLINNLVRSLLTLPKTILNMAGQLRERSHYRLNAGKMLYNPSELVNEEPRYCTINTNTSTEWLNEWSVIVVYAEGFRMKNSRPLNRLKISRVFLVEYFSCYFHNSREPVNTPPRHSRDITF